MPTSKPLVPQPDTLPPEIQQLYEDFGRVFQLTGVRTIRCTCSPGVPFCECEKPVRPLPKPLHHKLCCSCGEMLGQCQDKNCPETDHHTSHHLCVICEDIEIEHDTITWGDFAL